MLRFFGEHLSIFLPVLAGILSIPLYVFARIGLERCYLAYGRRYCRQQGWQLARWRSRPEFNAAGVKTECTLLELDCRDADGQARSVELRVWLFGIRGSKLRDPETTSAEQRGFHPPG